MEEKKRKSLIVIVRKMLLGDCYEAAKVIMDNSYKNSVISIPPKQLLQWHRRYWVGIHREKIVATLGYRIFQGGLAEIRSLVVSEQFRGNGIGQEMLRLCLEEIKAHGYRGALALTVTPKMFLAQNFEPVDISHFHQKVAADCRFCPHGYAGPADPRCKETALHLKW